MSVQRTFHLTCLAAVWLLLLSASLNARCIDEARLQAEVAAPDEHVAGSADPRTTLHSLVREALDRSQQMGPRNLLADADADADAEVSDSDRPSGWRTQLAESVRLGHLTLREQLATNTVALALERGRYRQHAQIYGQYVRKMECLVEDLDRVRRADRARSPELEMARQSLQQARLLLTGAQSQARAVDVRLRRLVGDGLPGVQGLSTVLLQVRPLTELVAESERPTEIGAVAATVATATATANVYANAHANAHAKVNARPVESRSQPQLSWAFTGGAAAAVGRNPDTPGSGRSGNFAFGVAVTIPLFSPGWAPASNAARRRAEAVSVQRLEVLEARRVRVVALREQVLSSFDRARRTGAVLRETEELQNFTLQQWQQWQQWHRPQTWNPSCRLSLFEMLGAQAEHYQLRVAYVSSLYDGQQMNALLLSLGRGIDEWLK